MACFLSLAVVLAVAPAVPSRAQKLAREAVSDYSLGYFQSALAEAQDSYALDPRPELLFQLAQCHRALGHWQLAATHYRSYLQAVPNAKNHQEVQSLLAAVEARLPSSKPNPPAEERPLAEPKPSAPPPSAPPAALEAREPIARVETAPAATHRVWPWVLGAGAVVGAAASCWGWVEVANFQALKSPISPGVSLAIAEQAQSTAQIGEAFGIVGAIVAAGLLSGAVLTW